jgi:hypothetical protein
MPYYATIGRDIETGEEITIGDIERRSGLYILGKPGMGKTLLLDSLVLQDIEHGHGVFFLDPHGDAFRDIFVRLSAARKYGVATTVAHQERFGQFSEDYKIQGATAAAANKIFFQMTVRDSQELAPEFANPPPVETRPEPEYTLSQNPFEDLLRGHTNPKINEFAKWWIQPFQGHMEEI